MYYPLPDLFGVLIFFSGYLEDIILILLDLLYMHNVNLFPLVKGEIKYNSSSSAYLCSQFITD